MIPIVVFYLRAFVAITFANETPTLEDVSGAQWVGIGPDPTAYVYSGRDNASIASQAGKILGAQPGANVVAIADVRGLNFWPVNGIVKDAITSQSKKDGTNVLMDWTGSWGNMLGLPEGSCSVIITDGKHVVTTTDCSVVIEGATNVK